MIKNRDLKIFSGSTGIAFANKVCTYLGVQKGKSETIRFSDGNLFVRINETVREKDIFFIQPIGLKPNDEFVEILFWIDAFKRASAHSVTVVIPYFGYAKGDKKDEPRVSIRARVCAEAIEMAGADRVVSMDLYSPKIQGFFKIPVDNLLAMPVFVEYFKRIELKNFVIVSPDAGYTKKARKFAAQLGVSVAIGDKIRKNMMEDQKCWILSAMLKVKMLLLMIFQSQAGRL